MTDLTVSDLSFELGFGARVKGSDRANLRDSGVQEQLLDLFERRGVIVFEEVESSPHMLVAISDVFGPKKEHPVPSLTRVDGDHLPGVIEFAQEPGVGDIIEIDGEHLMHWLPWHFDHCYNDELNRAAVLRAVTISPKGGLTGFADGIELYNAISEDLRAQVEGRKLIYKLNLIFDTMRFVKRKNLRTISVSEDSRVSTEHAANMLRSVHPIVWTRPSGEKILHATAWMAEGIEGQENPEGDALLDQLFTEMDEKVNPYFHAWQPDQMVVWDNWRMLHSVTGSDPNYPRCMQRTTILGDYGLGYFENEAA